MSWVVDSEWATHARSTARVGTVDVARFVMADAWARGRGWRLRISREALTVYRRRCGRWHLTMDIPADRLVELEIQEVPRLAHWRPSGCLVICTLTGGHRALFVPRGLSERDIGLALAPVLAELEASRRQQDRLHT